MPVMDAAPQDELPPLVDLVIEDARWEALGLDALADRAARATLAALDLPAEGFTSCLMACDDARIAELNGSFRGKSKPTNVLSWPAEELGPRVPGGAPLPPIPGTLADPTELGDMALAYETCMAEARDQGKTPQDHVTHLFVHGLLHLLGHDHIHPADAERMESIEVRVLAPLGVSDPY